MYKCGICGKEFNLTDEKVRRVKYRDGSIIETTYVCMKCTKKKINEMKKEMEDYMKRMRKKYHKYYCK